MGSCLYGSFLSPSLPEEQEHISNVHTKCSIHFKRGILEELLKVYQNLPYGKALKKDKKKTSGSSLFARFFQS